MRKIIGSDENSKFNIFEIFFDNVDFGNADSENDVPVSTTDNVTIIDPAINTILYFASSRKCNTICFN